jgi:serine/threonine protein kinase
MAQLVISCPKCGYQLHLPDRSFLGRKGRCPECRQKFIMEEQLVFDERTTDEIDDSTVAAMAGTLGDDDIPEEFGRYHVVEQIGQGSMGAVYLAHDSELDRMVALKIPSFDESDGHRRKARFYREARAAATLRHSNICQVYDVGEIGGTHFIAMAYIHGNPLSTFIKQTKPQPVRKIATTVRKLAKALQAAHDNGIVHRDLKPDNIMIDDKGEPIVMDFGLARLMDDDDRLTVSGAIVGSPAYMSPEQIDCDDATITPASDIFSLGVITYQLLTRQLPFRGKLDKIFDQITSVDPVLPSTLRPDVDHAIESICLKMMAKRVSDRYLSMNEVAAAISSYLKTPLATPVAGGPAADRPVAEPVEVNSIAAGCDERAAKWILKIGGKIKISTDELNSVDVTDVDHLSEKPYRVVDVDLRKNNEVDDDGMQHFCRLDGLLTLKLCETNITDEGISYLNGLVSLTVLDLSYTKVTDAGLDCLVRLKELKQLDLANTTITDAGLTHVKKLTSLQFLGLYATAVTNAGLQQLSRLKKLQFLGLYGTPVTAVGVKKLKKSLPRCRINR